MQLYWRIILTKRENNGTLEREIKSDRKTFLGYLVIRMYPLFHEFLCGFNDM